MPDLGAQITQHALERLRERFSWNQHTAQRMADRALVEGLTHAQSGGRLNRWITKLFLDHHSANNIRIYGEVIYLFQGTRLITAYGVPNNLRRAAVACAKAVKPKETHES